MNNAQLEARVWTIIEAVRAGQPIEDSHLELKADWPKPVSAARRIAGHANAAGGEQILWVIGLDEIQGVCGASFAELSNWWSQTQAQFDSVTPDLVMSLNVPADGAVVVVLLFDTDRPPYVVKNPQHGMTGGGAVSLEVPWREGTAIRSARRSDLLRTLVPAFSLPSVEVLSAHVYCKYSRKNTDYYFTVSGELYFEHRFGEQVTIPFHKCTGYIAATSGSESPVPLRELRLHAPQRFAHSYVSVRGQGSLIPRAESVDSLTVDSTSSELVLSGPGRAKLSARAITGDDITGASLVVHCSLAVVGNSLPVRFSALLLPIAEPKSGDWEWSFVAS